MAFCGNCGTKAVGEFCVNCGAATVLAGSGAAEAKSPEAIQPPAGVLPTVTFEDFERNQDVGIPAPAKPEPQQEIPAPTKEPMPVTINEPAVSEPSEPVVEEPSASEAASVASQPEQESAVQAEDEPAETSEEVSGIEAAASVKPRKRSKRGLLITAGVLLLLGAALVPGSGEVKVVLEDETSANPPVGFELQIGDEKVEISKSFSGNGVVYTGQWSTFDFDNVKITPNPKDDEFLAATSLQFGTTGIWNLGREVTIRVIVSDSWTEMRIEGPNNFFENRVATGFRSNFAKNYINCEADYKQDHALSVNLPRQANANYLKYVKETQLDGTRTLTYVTWANRADNLQRKLTSYLNLMQVNALPFPVSVHDDQRSEVVAALMNLRSAWSEFESISRKEDEDRWDGAWTKIYEREGELLDAVRAFRSSTENAKDEYCDGQLLRN